MVDALGEIYSFFQQLWSKRVFEATLDSIFMLVIVFLMIKTVHYINRRMAERNILTQSIADRINKIISLILYSFAILMIVYFYVRVAEILYVFVLVAIIAAIYAWDAMANLLSYYAITFSRTLNLGDTIVFEGHIGKIREINKLSTVIKTLDGDTLVVPNRLLLSRVYAKRSDTSSASIVLRLKNLDDLEKLDEFEKKIREIILVKFKHGIRTMEPGIHLSSIKDGVAEYVIGISMVGYEPKPQHLASLAKLLAKELRNHDLEIEIPYTRSLIDRRRG